MTIASISTSVQQIPPCAVTDVATIWKAPTDASVSKDSSLPLIENDVLIGGRNSASANSSKVVAVRQTEKCEGSPRQIAAVLWEKLGEQVVKYALQDIHHNTKSCVWTAVSLSMEQTSTNAKPFPIYATTGNASTPWVPTAASATRVSK